MAKQAYMMLTKDELCEMLGLGNENVIIDDVIVEDRHNVKIFLSGTGLPVDDGSTGTQVKVSIDARHDTERDVIWESL